MKKYLVMSIIFSLVLTGCKGKEENAGREQKEELLKVTLSDNSIKETGIEISEARFTSISGYITATARIIPNQDEEAVVGTFVKGRVKKVFFNPGSFVKQGQALMELEGLEIGEIKSAYRKTKAQLDFTEAAYKRQKTLNEQNVTSSKSLLESKAEYDKALAEFKAEDEKIHSIGLTDEEALDNLSDHSSGKVIIKAPIAGIISERNVILGELVDESTNAFKIINTANVWAEGRIYEKDVPDIKGALNVSFITSIYPNETFSGRMIFTSPSVDEKTRTVILRAAIPNTGGKLKPEIFGELKIPVTNSVKTIVMPADAVINDNGKYFVFVQTGNNTFEKRDVKTGIREGNNVEIAEGVKEKEKVVTKGAFYLKSELLKSQFGEEE